MTNDKSKMLKVVYFDENSAIDYLDVYNGGLKSESEDRQDEIQKAIDTGAKLDVGTGILSKVLGPFIKAEAGGHIDASFARLSENVLRTTISNTVLTDYIKTAENDSKVRRFKGYSLKAHKESISFWKIYTPMLHVIKLENEALDFSKMDETLEMIKGYFELVATNNSNDVKILRFNIRGFRNNYKLVDLTRMKLNFFAIRVGEMELGELDAKRELQPNQVNSKIVTTEDILSDSKNEGSSEDCEEGLTPVYDVVLAGIMSDE